jgi:hypothetical protein
MCGPWSATPCPFGVWSRLQTACCSEEQQPKVVAPFFVLWCVQHVLGVGRGGGLVFLPCGGFSPGGGGASCCHHAVSCRCTSAFVQPAQCRCVLVVRASVGALCLVIHESWQWLLLLGWRCIACSFIRMECASSSYQPLLHVHTCITNCLRPCRSFTVHRGASLEGVT